MRLKNKVLPLIAGLMFMGCSNNMERGEVVRGVTTQEEQQALTAYDIQAQLTEGNKRFVRGELTNRDYREQVKLSEEVQFPKSVILSCLDSRVPVETVFDLGIGDAFVARVAGNISNEDILGSLEYATEVSGAKLVVVLGHENCGAVKSAKDGVELGNITPLLSKITPAVESVEGREDLGSYSDKELVNEISRENVVLTMENLRKESSIIKGLEEEGKVKIVGGIYEMATGEVRWLDL